MNCNRLFKKGDTFTRIIYQIPHLNFNVIIQFTKEKIEFPVIVDNDHLENILFEFNELFEDPNTINPLKLNDIDLKRVEDKYNQIKELIEAEPQIYNRRKRNLLIKSFLEKHKHPCKNTLYTRLKKIWSTGNKYGLYSDYRETGKNTIYKVKPGPKLDYREDYLITEEDKENIKEIIETFRKDNEIDNAFFSYSDAFEKYIQKYCRNIDSTLTKETFYRWARKISEELNYGKILDKGNYDRNDRPHFGSNRDGVLGIGHTYFIDATILNLNLVKKFNPNQCIGKPILFLVVDVYSHYIIGYYLGLENENYHNGNLAILNAISSKEDTLNKYETTKNLEWQQGPSPHCIVGDKGPVFAKCSDALSLGLGIDMTNTAARRPDFKGLVESLLKVIQYQVYFLMSYKGVNLPLKRAVARISLDTIKLTSCNFEICEQAILISINRINNRYRLNYSITQGMRENDIKPIPTEIFEYYKSTGKIFGNTMYDHEYLRKMLLYNMSRVYGQKGITFHYTQFIIKDRNIHEYLSDKNLYIDEHYMLFYNPSEFTEFYLLDDGEFYQLEALNEADRYYRTFAEFIHSRTQDANDNRINEINLLLNSTKPAEEITEQLEESKSKKNSKYNTKNNLSEERAAEKERINQNRKVLTTKVKKNTRTDEEIDPPKQKIKRYAR